MIKKVIIVSIILKLLFLVVTIYSLDVLVKLLIEYQGSKITSSKIEVGDVSVSLPKSMIEINNIKILNYDQFKSPYAAEVERISIELDIWKLFSKLVHIKKLTIEKPIIALEFTPRIDNLSFLTRRAEAHAKERKAEIKANHTEPFKVKVDVLTISSIIVSADIKYVDKLSISVPNIELRNLGGVEGDYASGIAAYLLEVLTKRVIEIGAENYIKQQVLKKADLEAIRKVLPEKVEKGVSKLLDNIFKAL